MSAARRLRARDATAGRDQRDLVLRILPVKYGEPHGRLGRIGPLDPVAPVRRDVEPVAGAEHAVVRLVGEAQPRRPREQHHPLGLGLVVPEPGRAPLPAGDDALDAQPRCGEKRVGDFAGARVRQVAQQVFHLNQ